MNTKTKKRIFFFSKHDLSVCHYLARAEPILRDFNQNKEYLLNDIVELFHIKQYLDCDLYLPKWTDEDKQLFKSLDKSIWDTISKFWRVIENENFIDFFEKIEVGYQPAFWQLIEKMETYKRISKEKFEEILTHKSLYIWHVLKQKNLVNNFCESIRSYMLNSDIAAEFLLKKYEENSFLEIEELYIPSCLSNSDKEQIILNYLNSSEPNLNYVRLVIQSTDNHLQISPKTRLKAKKLEEKLTNDIFAVGVFSTTPTQLMILPNQLEPEITTNENGVKKISYGLKWLEKLNDAESIIHVFSSLFHYTDIFGAITLFSKSSELDPLEKVSIKGKKEYLFGIEFLYKNYLANAHIHLISNYLESKNNSLEGVISSFINEILIGKYGIKNLRFSFPSNASSYLVKIRYLLPETESLLRQFKLYCETSSIDHELLEISSRPLNFLKIPCLNNKKYVYGTGKKFEELCFYFYSDQHLLWHIEPFKRKYRDLFGLLTNENVNLDDFESWQKDDIQKLISENVLFIDPDGHVRIWNELFILIIGFLHHNEFVSYWSFEKIGRDIIDYMFEKGLVNFGHTLFSEPEAKYLNYHLNKKDFSNSLDLRNKYVHGTNPDNKEEHKNDYYTLLRILILIILKIEHDLIIFDAQKVKSQDIF